MHTKYYLLLLLLLFFACEDQLNSPSVSTHLLMSDSADALLLQATGVDYNYFDENIIDYSGTAQAIITLNQKSFYNPDSILLDDRKILPSGKGQYQIFDENKVDSTGDINLNWKIYGYVDSNHTITQDLSDPIEFIEFKTLDTISKSSGINISYNGAENSDLTWWIQSGQFVTDSLLSSDSLTSIPESIINTQSDNGVLSISSNQIDGLTPNRYYLLILEHLKDTTITSKGKLIDLKSFSETEICFYLDD